MIAAIYARKSTEQNGMADEAKSVTRQIERATAYAAAKGWTVPPEFVFVDDGISGAEFQKRPGFLRLMNALTPSPGFQILIMSEESRLGREQVKTAYAMQQIIEAGVRLFFYLEDRERTLDSPTDKLLMSVAAFADELEREKARQRTYDAMSRKAAAGHACGGRVFGYDNVRTEGVGVRRVVNEAEAAVVRQIFALTADAVGKASLAKRLNEAHAPAPRSQQGRPRGWSPSSVHEILHRELYRGVIVWNRTRKRDAHGRQRQTARPESEWLRVPAPELRIVSEAEWQAAHAYLARSRASYLRGTGGRLFGRPRATESAYLLTSFARCGVCGGGVFVKYQTHGSRGHRVRKFFYGCASYHRRGATICGNGLELPMGKVDEALIETLLANVLTPDVIEDAISTTLDALAPERRAEAVAHLKADLGKLDGELGRLAEAVASDGSIPTLLAALRERQRMREAVAAKLAAAEAAASPTHSRSAIRARLRTRLEDWRGVLRQHPTQARQILRKLLAEPLVLTPLPEKRGVRVTGKASYGKLLSGVVSPATNVASPTGLEDLWMTSVKAPVLRVA